MGGGGAPVYFYLLFSRPRLAGNFVAKRSRNQIKILASKESRLGEKIRKRRSRPRLRGLDSCEKRGEKSTRYLESDQAPNFDPPLSSVSVSAQYFLYKIDLPYLCSN